MKLFKKATLAAAFTAFTLPVLAQTSVSIAPEVGVVYYTNISISNSSFASFTSTGTGVGGRAGVAFDFGFSDRISLQPGLYFSYDHYTNDFGVGFGSLLGDKVDATQYNGILPINLQLKFKGFFIGAGPYLGYTFGGKIKESISGTNGAGQPITVDTTYDIKVGSDAKKDYTKPFSLGFGINSGYKLNSGLFFRAQFLYGLLNTSPASDGTMHGYSAALSLGYFLGGNGGGRGLGRSGPSYRFRQGYVRPYSGVR